MSKNLIHDQTIDFQVLMEKINECIWIFDFDKNKFLYISPSIFKLKELSGENAILKKAEDILTIEPLQKIINSCLHRYQRFLNGERNEDIINDVSEYQHACKDGSIKHIELSTRFDVNYDTNHIVVIGIIRDITKRKLYEKKLIDTIRNQHKIIKEYKSVNDGSSAELYLYFFGKFRVFKSDFKKPLKWRTSKTEELFAFLLEKEKPYVSKDKILEALWPDLELDKALKYLHTTLYNLKKDLKSVNIDFKMELINGFYCYDTQTFYSDLNELKYLIKTNVTSFDTIDTATIQEIERALLLYEGDFLAENGYRWATTQTNYLKFQFEKYAFDLARHYFFNHDYSSTKRVLKKLLEIDNLNEKYHELLLKVFLFNDDYVSFARHYDHLKKLLLKELNQLPNDSIQALYKSIS
ncbi:BTAD domain-containing putative transcriptional regulator [Acetobacterium woodii]|uniref:PAC domain-containing protein n=1 Tax=Acetobacterium woodii (strain ATCC 29683 / DSM 1030 / JCM 2381 / KCTC 1655 / WB1) TaxID=931626 RepID=H6LGP4_ACEWD|nr:BTAD domain-containing putative transcriptional regulator [Acetobacterium woodii]AFA48372.1 hypothetical protein containing PAS domain [Acetobacterium woodii DSM 1030]